MCWYVEMDPDPIWVYFWPTVNKRPTRLWSGYFLTRPKSIFWLEWKKNWKILRFYVVMGLGQKIVTRVRLGQFFVAR